MTSIINDIQYALRRLGAAPVFAATAIGTLAVGIGANTVIFSLVYGVLLQPLPFPSPDRLYAVYSANRASDLLRASVSPVDLDDWRAQRQNMENLGGYWYGEGTSGVDLTGRGSPRRLSAVFVTAGFFETLGVEAARGRLPREDELVRGGRDTVVLLTHGFWTREFGGESSAVGSTLSLNGRPFDVIGVLPPDLRVPEGDIDVMLPYSTIPDSAIPRLRQVRVLNVIARAKPGATRENVSSELNAIAARLAAAHTENRLWTEATVVPLAEVITEPVEAGLVVLLAAVGFLLIMTCVNVAHLQLARVIGRGREIAVRLALGAGRGRLVQLLLVESVMVSVLGGLAGLMLAMAGLQVLLTLGSGQLPRASEIAIDGPVLAFTAGVSLLTGLVVAVAPSWRLLGGGLSAVLRDGGRAITAGRSLGTRRVLVVAEVAVAIVLVVGAGLMSRSFLALMAVETGFNPDKLLAVQFTIDPRRHAPPASTPGPGAVPSPPTSGSPYLRYYSEVIESVRRLPGVVSAAAVKDPPFRGNGERVPVNIPGRPTGDSAAPTATVIHISDGYFRTIGARIEGREFAPTDRAGAPLVIVVNEAFVRQFFPGENGVGKRVAFGAAQIEIIGVVGDIRQVAMAEPARPTMYIHNLQNGRVKTTLVVRTAGEPLAMADAVRRVIWSLDKDQAITSVFTFDETVSRAMARPRLLMVILGSFGAIGLILGAIGLYGVLAALVSERRREIGVRLALGAEPRQVLAMIVRGGLGLTLVGVSIGLLAAFGLSRFLTAVLYGISPGDPLTFAGTAALFILVATMASSLPALRASRVDPVETLRAE
jgi:predicted permease